MLLAASSASSAATAARHGPFFDPATALGWAVPLILLAPLLAFVMIVSGIRTRRAAANVGLVGTLLAIAATVLVASALVPRKSPYTAAYQWMNMPLAFSGPAQFQGFGIDISLRVDHAALAAIGAVLAVTLGIQFWARTGSRGEPGLVRFHALSSLATFAALAAMVSGDLAELVMFWILAGALTYLLVGQRWGIEASARAAWSALAVPAVGDLALLGGVGLLYSRYGELNMDKLFPVLHTVPGWGLKSLTAAAVLILAGAVIRAGLFPFQAWHGSTAAPAPVVAWVQGVWPLLGAMLIFRTLPVFHAAGPQALTLAAVVGGLSAIAGPAWALLGNDARRVAAGAGMGQAGLGFLVLAAGRSGAGLAGVLAGAPARAGLILAAGSLVAAMRTPDIALMGEGRRRLPVTSLAALLAGLALPLSLLVGAAAGIGSAGGIVADVGLLLLAFAGCRLYFGATSGPLARRRAFEPNRVREVARPMAWSALALSVVAVILAAAALAGRWLGFLEPGRATTVDFISVLVFAALVIVGAVLAGAAYGARKRQTHARSALAGATAAELLLVMRFALDRFLARPGLKLVEGAESSLLEHGEERLAQSLSGSATLVPAGGPALARFLPAVVALGLVIALLVALAATGVYR